MSAELRRWTGDCPLPRPAASTVTLAHGGGGRLMQQLLERVVLSAFSDPALASRPDAALLDWPGAPNAPRLAFTTDSFVVRPLFFPGGDIGTLAVCGTVHDLAMVGGRPLWLSVGLILEEGLPMDTLERVVASLQHTAAEVGVRIVTGDTKVVERGKADGVFVNTAGVGCVPPGVTLGPAQVQVGDAVVLSGDLGRHGLAVLAARDTMEFRGLPDSDCAALARPVARLLEAGIPVHCLRDLTRGGLAAALVEIGAVAGVSIRIRESEIAVHPAVAGACEILGLDPLYVANEGRCVAFVPAAETPRVLAIWRDDPLTADARVIGDVVPRGPAGVTLVTRWGTERLVELFSGEQLPRIC